MRISNMNIQRVLSAAGYYNGQLDGKLGPKSEAGINKLLFSRSNELPMLWMHWSINRKAIAAFQLILKYAGFDPGVIDGLDGMLTQYAFEQWQYERTHGSPMSNDWRDDDIEPEDDDQSIDVDQWPHQKDLIRFFGQPGGDQCTAGKVNLPFPMKLAWDESEIINSFSCHELVADSAERSYDRIASAYSPEDITSLGFDLFGGCYNYRKKRGGKTLSTHAFGISIDTNPEFNQLRWGRDRATLAMPECEEFWRCWEAEGWLSLGRARNFDWMHVQAARL